MSEMPWRMFGAIAVNVISFGSVLYYIGSKVPTPRRLDLDDEDDEDKLPTNPIVIPKPKPDT